MTDKINVKLKSMRVVPSSIKAMRSVIESRTGIKTQHCELVDDDSRVVGFKFTSVDHTLLPMLECLESFPVVSSVKTNTYEKHLYHVGNQLWDVQIFFSREPNTGTFMVVQHGKRS